MQGLRPFGSPDGKDPVKFSAESFRFNYTITPKKGKNLWIEPPKIEIAFQGEIELDASDKACKAQIDSAFRRLMKQSIDSQLKHLNQWISEKDEALGRLVEKNREIYKTNSVFKMSTAPKSDPRWENIAAWATNHHKEVEGKIAKLLQDFEEITKNWAGNLVEQQGIISLQRAVTEARGLTIENKKARVHRGIVARAVRSDGPKIVLLVVATLLSHGAILAILGRKPGRS